MNLPQAEEILNQIATDGTDLNKAYLKWRELKITDTILNAMVMVNTADRNVSELSGVPGVGENGAATMVGYMTGRAKTLTDLQTLDEIHRKSAEDPKETFTEPAIDEE